MNENDLIMEQKIIPVDIETEMKKSFIDYAMSVIVDRALPDVRDGLKPVHRRILYAMYNLGVTADKPYRKCATTVGEVLGKFHPHGDAAVYESLVRMAQDFSLRYMLVDGHGNFGSIDGDAPAAMRYTEAKLSKISMEMLSDINKGTVNFKPNFDEREMEPIVLPSRFPNLLVNGSSGIAVGMATNIPPHNIGEVINGINATIDNPDITFEDLNKIIKGPDFPTGGIIVGTSGVKDAYRTGRGRIVVRAVTTIEQMTSSKERIIVTELPYVVNKARLIEKIAELVKDKKIDGISDLRDESDRRGMRIVIELKRDANANIVLNQLYKNTQMQDTFNVMMLALVPIEDKKFEPRILNLKQVIDYYILHQKEVIVRRTQYELNKAEARAHILDGLKIAIDNLDEVIKIIRGANNEPLAKQGLIDRFNFSDKQAQAIVDMRLGRLTALETDKLEAEYKELNERIKYYKEVLADEVLILKIIKDELAVIKTKFNDARRTKIILDEGEFDIEDLIQKEENVITMTHFGYIKRLPADTYKIQKRGGKGIVGLSTKQEDFVKNLFVTSTHNFMLFFTNKGRVYKLKVYDIPESSRQARGTAIVNLLQLKQGEKVSAVIPIEEFRDGLYLILVTKRGLIKKTDIMKYANIHRGGLIGCNLNEDDELIDVKLTDGKREIIIMSEKGYLVRFDEESIRVSSKAAHGVKGIKLKNDDNVLAMEVYEGKKYLLVITENGFGKRTKFDEYKLFIRRGGVGIHASKISEKTGKLIGMKLVNDEDELMLISSDSAIIRLYTKNISVTKRSTQGVRLIKMNEGTTVVDVASMVTEIE